MIEFLLDRPVVLGLAVLVLLLALSVPMGIIARRRREKAGEVPHHGGFMGARFDWTILVFGLFLLAAVAGAVLSAFR